METASESEPHIRPAEITPSDELILTTLYGLNCCRARTVEEAAQELGRSRSLIYYRLRKMKKLGIINVDNQLPNLRSCK
jgi:predicted transcriptional regulator